MADPYEKRTTKPSFYVAKGTVLGKIVAVLDLRIDNRGLNLIPQASRTFRSGDIVELVTTDETCAAPKVQVYHVAYIGFAEIETGGVILVGDDVKIGRKRIGEVCGFDETHAPNHINVVIRVSKRKTGTELNLALSASVEFKFKKP
jgi:hypothetical protein